MLVAKSWKLQLPAIVHERCEGAAKTKYIFISVWMNIIVWEFNAALSVLSSGLEGPCNHCASTVSLSSLLTINYLDFRVLLGLR